MSEELKDYVQVTENVFTTFVTKRENRKDLRPANTTIMTCFALLRELIFVDCGMDRKFAAKFRKDMENHFKKNTSHLILTHLHDDHYLAMEVFKDVDIIAPEIGIEILKPDILNPDEDYIQAIADQAQLYSDDNDIANTIRNSKRFLPNISVKEEMKIGPEGHELIIRVAGGHSEDSSYIFSPSEKVLCTGDNILSCYAQYVFNPTVIDTYKFWENLDVNHFIVGHGNAVNKDFISSVRKYFEELHSTLKELKKQNLTIDEVINHPSLPIYFGTKLDNWVEGGKEHTKWIEFVTKVWYEKFC
ncbi:MAG TPA: MBL fold metallo-hydrolase [candidate division Zixibacteria bacterium]|nr:MBL fold metallo-hydrolase [candidate division Zixibacteria bacterium]